MRRVSATLLFLCTLCFCASAQQTHNNVPVFAIDILEGRSGIALGPAFDAELNPVTWMGVFALIGRSGIGQYQTQGADAHAKDLLAGMGFVARLPPVKRMRFGLFFQSQYANTKIGATYPDGQGGIETYRQSSHYCLTTAGLNFETRITHGISFVARPGKNFMGGFAASQGGGLYFTTGLQFGISSLLHPQK